MVYRAWQWLVEEREGDEAAVESALELLFLRSVANHMEFLVTVDEGKAPFFLELMRNLRSVRVKPLTPDDTAIVKGLKSAIEEVKLARQGKVRLKSARELLHEV